MKAGKRVLIVDDELQWRKLLRQFLIRDYDVELTDDRGFQDIINKHTYDFVILDITMPIKSGMDVFEEIREVDQHCVVIVLSVLSSDTDQVKWFRERNVQVFCKVEAKYIVKVKAYLKSFQFKEPSDLSVLVVDDDQQKQDVYVALLKASGVDNIEVYSSLDEAEQRVKEKSFDVYLVDICFREPDGQLVAKGQRLVSLLQAQDVGRKSVIVPITTEPVGRDYLTQLASGADVHPIFYERSKQFRESIESVIQRGPFRRQMDV